MISRGVRHAAQAGRCLSSRGKGTMVVPTPKLVQTLPNGPGLGDFIGRGGKIAGNQSSPPTQMSYPVSSFGGEEVEHGNSKDSVTFFIETYGCQMNVSDTEVVRSILLREGFKEAGKIEDASVVLANTCAIREKAEGKVWDRLQYFASVR
ncbi:unnamed protein product [Choristocarpus tenellus]